MKNQPIQIQGGTTLWGLAKEKLQKTQGADAKITNQQIIAAMKAIASANGYDAKNYEKFAKENFYEGRSISVPEFSIEHDTIAATKKSTTTKKEKVTNEVSANVQKYNHEEKQLKFGGEIIGAGLAIEHLSPESDLDRLNAARKEVESAVKANTYYTSESGRSYGHAKGPTAERVVKAYENFEKANQAYQKTETLIKADKEVKAAGKEVLKSCKTNNYHRQFIAVGNFDEANAARHKAAKALQDIKIQKAERNLKAATKEVKSALEANTYYTSESGRSYMHAKGPTAKRQFKAVRNFEKAQKSYNEAKKYKVTDKEINKTIKTIKTTRVLSKVSKVVGKAATPVAVAAEGYNVYTEYKKGGKKAAVKQAVRSSGAIAAAWAGAKGGAAVGIAIGSVFPGAGNLIGGAIGGVIGGVAGYIAGDKIMKQTVK